MRHTIIPAILLASHVGLPSQAIAAAPDIMVDPRVFNCTGVNHALAVQSFLVSRAGEQIAIDFGETGDITGHLTQVERVEGAESLTSIYYGEIGDHRYRVELGLFDDGTGSVRMISVGEPEGAVIGITADCAVTHDATMQSELVSPSVVAAPTEAYDGWLNPTRPISFVCNFLREDGSELASEFEMLPRRAGSIINHLQLRSSGQVLKGEAANLGVSRRDGLVHARGIGSFGGARDGPSVSLRFYNDSLWMEFYSSPSDVAWSGIGGCQFVRSAVQETGK